MQEILSAEELHHLYELILPDWLKSLSDVLPGLINASLYLTTPLQKRDLAGSVESLNVRGDLSEWRFIAARFHDSGTSGLPGRRSLQRDFNRNVICQRNRFRERLGANKELDVPDPP